MNRTELSMLNRLSLLLQALLCWAIMAIPAFCQSGIPPIEHVVLLDTSGSMSSYRPQWGQYGTYENGFAPTVTRFLGFLLAPDGQYLRGEDAAVLYPCSFYGKRDEKRREAYRAASQNLTLQDMSARLGARADDGKARCPGPDSDGAMGNDGMLQGLRQAMQEAHERQSASLHVYWFLTDNGFDDSAEKLPEEFYKFLARDGEKSLAQVWFAPLRQLPDGNGNLVLYVIIQEDTPGLWQASWSDEMAEKVLQPRLEELWPNDSFRRRLIDLRATQAGEGDDIVLLAEPKDFQRCLTPIPADAFSGADPWCSMRRVPSVKAGQDAYAVDLLDNRQSQKSGYEYASSVRCNVRPSRGWNICNVNVPGGRQPYSVVSPLSDEEKRLVESGLFIEFGQAATVAKGSKRGAKPIVWTFASTPEVRRLLTNYPQGVELELQIKMPTTIDFSKLAEQQQSGLDKELFAYIAHLDLLERFIMGAAVGEQKVQREWVCENPVRLTLTAGAGDWLDQMLNQIMSQAAPGSALAKAAALASSEAIRPWLLWILIAILVALLLIIALLIWLIVSLRRRKRKNKTATDEDNADNSQTITSEDDDYYDA